MRRRERAILAAGLLLLMGLRGGGAGAAERCALADPAPASVILVQDSGWMEPFFDDPRSEFRPLLRALAGAVAPPGGGGTVVVAAFDQDGQVPGRRSPDPRYCGAADAGRIDAALDGIALPRQPDRAYADADLDGALAGAVNGILSGHPGIVWLVTNNRNSRNNSQATNDETRAFADRLRHTAALPAVVAFPLRLPVTGREFSAGGLIVYGIAYGAAGAAQLDRVLRSAPVRELFPEPAVRLKPLDQAPVSFVPDAAGTIGGDGVRAAMENGVLVIRGVPGGRASVLEISGGFRSNYYPQVIEHAAVAAEWRALSGLPAGSAVPGSVEPAELERLGAGNILPGVRIRLPVPAIRRSAGWAGLLQDDVAVSGTVAIRLSAVRLGLGGAFQAKMAQIAALDQLPGVFFDFREVSEAETLIPVRLVVRFAAWQLAGALALGGAALAGLAALGWLLRRARDQVVVLDGEARRLRLRPFERRQVVTRSGRRFTVRGRMFGAAAVAAPDPPPPPGGATGGRR